MISQKIKIRNVGNSSGIILPKDLLEKFNLAPGQELDLKIEGNGFFISKVPTLDELVQTIPKGETFTEFETGKSEGAEK